MKCVILDIVLMLQIVLLRCNCGNRLDPYLYRNPRDNTGSANIAEWNDEDYGPTDPLASHFVKFITDPLEISEITKKPVTSEGYVIDEFEPLPFPADFKFYDVNGDELITIQEMIDVTGEAENMELAFEATDTNRDGYVTKSEFKRNPWGVDVT